MLSLDWEDWTLDMCLDAGLGYEFICPSIHDSHALAMDSVLVA